MNRKIIKIRESQLEKIISENILYGKYLDVLTNVFNKVFDIDKLKDLALKKLSSTISNRPQIYFRDMSDAIINGIEGGYYHPRMKLGNMGDSGETMFGLDRKNGKQEKTALGREFWGLIDKKNAKYNWPWNYMGGSSSEKLRDLASKIMEPLFNAYSKKYLTPKAYDIMMSDPRIYFNFAYATWNGIGWFQRFAEKFNQEVESGVTNKNRLAQFLLNLRRNSGNQYIAGSTDKVKQMMMKVS